MSLALLGIPKSWHSYQDYVNGRENFPNWEGLWSDLVQEELRRNTRDGSSSKNENYEDCALASKVRKGKAKKFNSKSESKYGKKHDMSKVKCFHCHEHGHFSTNCPQKKKNKKAGGFAACEALASKFELDFSLIACMVSNALGSMWY